jgi:hypothetical protein
MLAQEAVVKPDAGHVEAGGASVVGVGLGDAPAVSDAVGLADTVDELLRVVDGVADGVPVALPVALPVDVTVPDWLGVLLLLSETEPVMEALAPAAFGLKIAVPPVVACPMVWPFVGTAVVAPLVRTLDGVQYAATAPMQLDTEYVIAPTSPEPETASVNVREDCAEEICEVLYVTPCLPGTLPETVIAEEPEIEAIIGIQVHDEEMAPTFGVKIPVVRPAPMMKV